MARTNSEALLGVSSRRGSNIDYSKGIAITSIFHGDEATCIEPVRFPDGSGFILLIAGPIFDKSPKAVVRMFRFVWEILRHPLDQAWGHNPFGWARRSTILLVMQTTDNRLRLRLGRSLLTFFRRDIISKPDIEQSLPPRINIAHQVTHAFADKNKRSCGWLDQREPA